MKDRSLPRREFIKSILAGAGVLALDWSVFPVGAGAELGENEYDAIVIGSGLGGLSCAAAFARQGFKPLVLEKQDRPGGYAITFSRPGGFVFDASLHTTSVGEREGVYNLIPGFPEITDVEFVPHPYLYRAIFPEHDIRVAPKDIPAYISQLVKFFPEEKQGIGSLIDNMKGVAGDIQKLSAAGGQVDMSRFPVDFPYLFKCYSITWGQMMDQHIKDPKLKAVVSCLWGYFGLPPSKLASFYYALPTIGFLANGGYYPIGKSQKISDAFAKFIEGKGGKVMLNTEVKEILTKDHAAYGVKTGDGTEYRGRVVVSNANAYDTFHKMIQGEEEALKGYFGGMEKMTVSLSTFQVFLGLKKNLVGDSGIRDTEIFVVKDYDPEAEFEDALKAKVGGNFGLTLYDNLYKGYSPEGKNIVNIIVLQGYDFWKQFEADYFKGKKEAYNEEKNSMTDVLIDQAEAKLLPGLRDAIEIKEAATPLTNMRYTANYRGGIYGWDQTVQNSGNMRMPHETPIGNLYLASAWTQPGGGYGGVIWSGLECFGQIMQKW
jgi:all-trans-retinol 13,14-reductase